MTFVEAARSYLGVPWKHMGRSRRGLDCAGLPILALKDIGVIDPPDPKRYGRNPFQSGLEKYVSLSAEQVWRGGKGACRHAYLNAGDIVLMAPASLPRHLGIVAEDPMYVFSLIHADGSPGVGRVVEHGLTDFYLKMIVAVYRRKT